MHKVNDCGGSPIVKLYCNHKIVISLRFSITINKGNTDKFCKLSFSLPLLNKILFFRVLSNIKEISDGQYDNFRIFFIKRYIIGLKRSLIAFVSFVECLILICWDKKKLTSKRI